jgi:hypothetical protein
MSKIQYRPNGGGSRCCALVREHASRSARRKAAKHFASCFQQLRQYLPYWSYSGRIEAVVWSIPTLTITFIGGLIWIGSYKLDPFRPLPSGRPPLEVQVVSLDWKWLFIYPQQHIATVNQLMVPAGRPVHFSITSASVFNVAFVPRLGSMIYAMPGMVSQLDLQADEPAQMWGISAVTTARSRRWWNPDATRYVTLVRVALATERS